MVRLAVPSPRARSCTRLRRYHDNAVRPFPARAGLHPQRSDRHRPCLPPSPPARGCTPTDQANRPQENPARNARARARTAISIPPILPATRRSLHARPAFVRGPHPGPRSALLAPARSLLRPEHALEHRRAAEPRSGALRAARTSEPCVSTPRRTAMCLRHPGGAL